MKSRWFSLPLVSFLASCGTHEGAAGAEGPGGDPTTSDGGGKDASAASEDDAGSGGGNDLDAHPAEDAGEPDEGADAGDGAGSEDPDAAACTGAARTTATAADFVGDWSAGDYPSDFSGGNYLSISGVAGQMGNARQYAVHVPTGYRKDTAYPALFCFHGLAQNAAMFCLDTGVEWTKKADQAGFVVIMPNGYMNSWNAGTCCGNAASAGLDDVALVRAIFAEVSRHLNLDLRRVYATGLSNGGYLSYRLACEASDLFVAVAPTAAAIGTAAIGGGTSATSDLKACAPTDKVSILDIHGTADPLIPYATQKPSLAILQSSDGCEANTAPATVAPSGGDTTCVRFTGCPRCPNVSVTACSIEGGGHCWFGSSDCGTGGGAIGNVVVGNNSNFMKNTDVIWAFLSGIAR